MIEKRMKERGEEEEEKVFSSTIVNMYKVDDRASDITNGKRTLAY